MSTLALCIPAYNATAFIGRLLTSARTQTVPFDEIWVYDDASTDQTADLALSFGARVVRGEKNAGCSHGKNILATRSQCDWLHFHDADDDLAPDFVAHARAWMRRGDAPDVVLFAYRCLDDATERDLGVRRFDHAALTDDPVAVCFAEQLNPFCGLYRRSSFLACGGWDEDPAVLPSEDQAGHLRMALAGLRFGADEAVTVINRLRAGSMTSGNLARCPRATYSLIAKNQLRALPRHRPVIARRLWGIAGSAAAFLDWSTADSAVLLARRIAPGKGGDSSLLFRLIAQITPRLALRLREYWIRLAHPPLRPDPPFPSLRR